MGTVFQKQTTRPLPRGAVLVIDKGREVARWLVRGKKRTAPTTIGKDGHKKIVQLFSTYVMKYRDAEGEVIEETTGCRDESAARRILSDREKQVEKIKAGIFTQAEL